MKCRRCHGSGRVNEARQSVPCPVCRWMARAAEEIACLAEVEEWTSDVERIIEAHYRAAVEEQAKGVPF